MRPGVGELQIGGEVGTEVMVEPAIDLVLVLRDGQGLVVVVRRVASRNERGRAGRRSRGVTTELAAGEKLLAGERTRQRIATERCLRETSIVGQGVGIRGAACARVDCPK